MPDRIGRYRVTGLLGTGASSTVLRAHDPDLDVDVAVKLLADHLSAREDLVQRFLAEARVLRDLADPRVVGVHDLGVLDSGQPYLVMDLLDHGTLADRLDALAEVGARPSSADGLAVGLSLADAVQALDGLGLVHGDLKPENAFLSSEAVAPSPATGATDGPRLDPGSPVLGRGVTLVLGDFGLAGEQGSDAAGAGSRGYAAPEQERGAALDVRSDLYSASAVVHRVVRRAPPSGPVLVPPGSDGGAVAIGLEGFFATALAFDPELRPATVGAWRDALRVAVVTDLAASRGGPARTSSRRRVLVVLAVLLVVVLVGSTAVALLGVSGSVPALAALGPGPETASAPGLSRDGKLVTVTGVSSSKALATPKRSVGGASPQGVAGLPGGAILVARPDAHVVVEVATDGTVRPYAGTGRSGAGSDGVAATSSRLEQPTGLAVDRNGSVYIADAGLHQVLRVTPTGVISQFAGTGTSGSDGDGGSATAALLTSPAGMAVGTDGSLYIADQGANRIRRVDVEGTITTVAGTGDAGAGAGQGNDLAQLSGPSSVAVGPDGSVVLADTGNGRVVEVGAGGKLTILGSFDDPVAVARVGDRVVVLSGKTGELRRVEP